MIFKNSFNHFPGKHLLTREKADPETVVSTFITRGNPELLSQKKLAIFSSNAIQNLNQNEFVDFFERIKSLPLSLTGGWHSFIERILFNTAQIEDKANYIYYLARDLNSYQFNDHQSALLKAGKLLVLAREKANRRVNRNMAEWRNQLIFSQMNAILFLYIRPEGILHRCFEKLLKDGIRIFILDIPENGRFLCPDIVPVNKDNTGDLLII